MNTEYLITETCRDTIVAAMNRVTRTLKEVIEAKPIVIDVAKLREAIIRAEVRTEIATDMLKSSFYLREIDDEGGDSDG